MPLYEYECENCGFKFDELGPMNGSNPPCPRPVKMEHHAWAKFFLEAKAAFERGRLVHYPGLGRRVGPNHPHTVIKNIESDHTTTETHTLGEWIEDLFADPPCGGETRRLVSLSKFQLKGGGWADDGYDH
jgi:putative FmdB family regulatory protein